MHRSHWRDAHPTSFGTYTSASQSAPVTREVPGRARPRPAPAHPRRLTHSTHPRISNPCRATSHLSSADHQPSHSRRVFRGTKSRASLLLRGRSQEGPLRRPDVSRDGRVTEVSTGMRRFPVSALVFVTCRYPRAPAVGHGPKLCPPGSGLLGCFVGSQIGRGCWRWRAGVERDDDAEQVTTGRLRRQEGLSDGSAAVVVRAVARAFRVA